MRMNAQSDALTVQQKAYYAGIVLVITATLLFSIKAVLVKLVYRYGIDTSSLMMLRMLFSTPVYLVIAVHAWYAYSDQRPHSRDWPLIAVLGIAGYYVASYLDLQALHYITANLERLILYIYPSLVVIMSAMFLKRRMRLIEWMVIAAAYSGVALVFGTDLEIYDNSMVELVAGFTLPAVTLGALLVLGSAVAFAGYLVGSEYVLRRVNPLLFTSIAMLASTVVIAIHYLSGHNMGELLDYEAGVYWLAMGIALFSTVIPSFLMSAGIKRINASRASILGSVGPFSTLVLGALLLDEVVTQWHILGFSIVILATITLARLNPERSGKS